MKFDQILEYKENELTKLRELAGLETDRSLFYLCMGDPDLPISRKLKEFRSNYRKMIISHLTSKIETMRLNDIEYLCKIAESDEDKCLVDMVCDK